ncbi:hypothetical protein FB45DRAFT_821958 [Roridomyces roridus]|uniref:Uncharacterized protein n=1 Tax=Roridomyces roridus TaxID=1738132 RepID=A0AAD7CHB0_9AGAR|nr:hypothetical protein FB45DRAFT_821958 [Roridomyces roridus]
MDRVHHFGKLPHELVEIVQETFFLHLVATEPEKVVPDGKSLLSAMVQRPTEKDPTAMLHERVDKVVKDAFWKEARHLLSDPIPSVQIARLKGLLSDRPEFLLLSFPVLTHFPVREAMVPLFPPNHPILATLATPLPPTASPLISTTLILKEILVAMRQRAAPIRDADIDQLLARLDTPLSPQIPALGPSSSIKPSTVQLASLITSTMASILSLLSDMQSDLNQFVLGHMSESQLKDVVAEEAKKREKQLVLDIWGGTERIHTLWQAWLDELRDASDVPPKDRWIHRLAQSLGSNEPVSCLVPIDRDAPPDSTVGNQLPPQLFFTTPQLLYAQNYLQALVVAAALRALTKLPPSSQGSDFMHRIWSLLKAEIDEEHPSESPTKIINFADEVVRARRLVDGAVNENEEAQLRAAVDRTLTYNDPVFLLLRNRLLAALARHLCGLKNDTAVVNNHVPERMQTGRTLDERAGKRLRLDADQAPTANSPPAPVVKGFEDSVFVSGTEEIMTKLYAHLLWVDNVWNPNET